MDLSNIAPCVENNTLLCEKNKSVMMFDKVYLQKEEGEVKKKNKLNQIVNNLGF